MKARMKIIPAVLQVVARPVLFVVFKLFCRMEVTGLKNVNQFRRVIFAPNHVSELDSLIVGACVPLRFGFNPIYFSSLPKEFYKDRDRFGWRSYFYRPLFFKMVGAYPIRKGAKNYEYSLENHISILQDGGSVLIFPEGKMSDDGSFGEVHGGVIFLSESTNTPVIPIYVTGHFGMTFIDLILRRRTIKVHFHSPLYVQGLLHQIGGETPYRTTARVVLSSIRVRP